ncbi:MAG TPA: hypothetical protein VGK73_13620 [Polyangiaceae bacterium]
MSFADARRVEPASSAGAPSSVRSQSSAAPAAASASARASQAVVPAPIPVDATLGTFRLRVRIESNELDDPACGAFGCALCPTLVHDVSPSSADDAWVVGSCGLRGQLAAAGFVDRSAPWQTVRRRNGNVVGECESYVSHSAVLARSAAEAYVASDLRCGLDPSGIWPRPLERFDGKTWKAVRVRSPFRDAHESSPDLLAAGGKGPVYVAALGDDWHGPPECGVYELGAKDITASKLCRLPPPEIGGESERIASLVVDGSGTLWVSGAVSSREKEGGASKPFLWRRTQGTWHEEPFPDSGRLGTSADGSAWLFGKALWLHGATQWERVPFDLPAGVELVDLALNSAKDIWVADNDRVLHFDGRRFSVVPHEEPSFPFERIYAKDAGVWVRSQFEVWALERPNGKSPPAVTLRPGLHANRTQ